MNFFYPKANTLCALRVSGNDKCAHLIAGVFHSL